jgi:hypothetical protein
MDMAATLTRLGFDVETLLDPNKSALETAVRRWGERSAAVLRQGSQGRRASEADKRGFDRLIPDV